MTTPAKMIRLRDGTLVPFGSLPVLPDGAHVVTPLTMRDHAMTTDAILISDAITQVGCDHRLGPIITDASSDDPVIRQQAVSNAGALAMQLRTHADRATTDQERRNLLRVAEYTDGIAAAAAATAIKRDEQRRVNPFLDAALKQIPEGLSESDRAYLEMKAEMSSAWYR